MSKYTTELRFICETEAGLEESADASDVNEVIAKAREKIFDFDYGIYDPAYAPVLETKILRFYYTREICAETYGLWKMWLETRLRTIMPLYNKLYEAEMLKYSPLFDVDYTIEHKGENKSADKFAGNDQRSLGGSDTFKHTGNDTRKFDGERNDNSNTKTDTDSWNMYSDTPQGGLDGIAQNKYLTNASHDTVDGNVKYTDKSTQDNTEKTTYNSQNVSEYGREETILSHNTRDITGTNEYAEHVFGKRGSVSYAKLMIEYRKSLINIDEMIIHELRDLFFLLW